MKYYYIHPGKPQYFFPKNFNKHDLFLNFFTPFSLLGKISWYIFKKFQFYRYFFLVKDIEKFIPYNDIRNIVGFDSIISFNKGTIGPEQKITALCVENDFEFFIKYGFTSLSKYNIRNEYDILKQLSDLDFVPKIISFYEDENKVLLKTTILYGERLKILKLNDSIIENLLILSKQKIINKNKTNNNLISCFAHGDYCPWNMMVFNGKVLLFDWEMAGNYSLGYDLFTYIFQSNFLLNKHKSIQLIFNEYQKQIDLFFKKFNITNWSEYVKDFSLIKLKLEEKKGDKLLCIRYKQLLDYVQEI